MPATGRAIEISAHLNALIVWSFAFFGVTTVLFGVVRASGAVFAPLLMLVVSLWLIRLPFAYWMLERWHADAIWWSFPLGSVASMMMAIAYYRYGGWRHMRFAAVAADVSPAGGP